MPEASNVYITNQSIVVIPQSWSNTIR